MNRENVHRAKEARNRLESFKSLLLREARYTKGSLDLTDEEIAALTEPKLSPRTVQRFLKKLKDLGDVEVKRHRYWAGYGWCNNRTLHFREEDLIIHHNLGGN